jgi:hypothetical protein
MTKPIKKEKFKDEPDDKLIRTFVGVRSKVYAIENEDPINKKLNESTHLLASLS